MTDATASAPFALTVDPRRDAASFLHGDSEARRDLGSVRHGRAVGVSGARAGWCRYL